jgi:hypothetical protein
MASQVKNKSAIIKIISVCVGLTFAPIILSFAFWIAYGWWKLDSFLTPDIIRAILFILIADISMVISGILIFLGYPMLNKKIHLRLSTTTIITLLATSIAAGVLIDYFVSYIESGGIDAPFSVSCNFTVAFPFFVLLLIIVIHLFRIKNKAVIIISSVVFSVLLMAFTFWFYAKKLGSQPTEFYGLIYVIGFVPALIVGLTYGLVIGNRLDRRCANKEK